MFIRQPTTSDAVAGHGTRARRLGPIASGSKKFWDSNAAATRLRSTRSYRKIGLASVCDTVSKTPFIASRSRIQYTVPGVLPLLNCMELQQLITSLRCVVPLYLQRSCV